MGNVAAMEWDHHVQSIFLEMCHSTIDELPDPNEGVHRSAEKELVVNTVQTVVTHILSNDRGKFEL